VVRREKIITRWTNGSGSTKRALEHHWCAIELTEAKGP
jgi:hypothetical protein